jgi:hypothetical protein
MLDRPVRCDPAALEEQFLPADIVFFAEK